ncbi:hypothetical protein [Microbacterium sp. BH-3-3-3]|uniref:hypothetical protein n=1 Tax=Microbacterium sp. BH-3-3-3 TaxID=1906742 RepID=UPI00119D0162|nr:hypothetical protein [Microbacterium sp. BH-3-3-3]
MTGTATYVPAHASTDITGMDELLVDVDPLTNNGTLLFVEPGSWRTDPTGAASGTIPNQSAWAQDIVGTAGNDLTLAKSSPFSGVVELTSKKALHVAQRRSASVAGNETYTLGNQAIRDFIVANPTHRYLFAVSMAVTRPASSSWVPLASHRIMGLVDGTDDRMDIRVNTALDTISGYPTNDPPRKIVQTLLTATGIGVAAAAFQHSAAFAASASSTLLSFHNGGQGGPGMSFKVFFALVEDLTLSGKLASDRIAQINARHQAQIASGGLYFGDQVITDPTTLT